MNDCQNADVRDRLPDLLHERLSDGERALVLAHVDACAECRDELEVLRGVRGALIAGTPRVNTLRILSALPKPGAGVVVPLRPTRSRWSDWRIAAAVTVLAVGGGSFALFARSQQGAELPPVASAPVVTPTPAANTVVAPVSPTPDTAVPTQVAATSEPVATPVSEVMPIPVEDEAEVGGRLTKLTEPQLRALLKDIGEMKAVPVTEPDPITIKMDTRSSGSSGVEMF